MKTFLLILLSGMALLSIRSFADDSAMMGIGGGMVAPMIGHPSVRMVDETVSVKLTDGGAKVHCEFHFHNEGKKCIVKMGFPEQVWASGDGGTGAKLSEFSSWVDGKQTKCVYKAGKEDEEREGWQARMRKSWYVKDVLFESGQSRTVVDEYSTTLGASSTSGSTDYESDRTFTYILQTGRNWKGTIGKATINVDVSGVSVDHYEIVPHPSSFARHGNLLSWTFTDFEPSKDITINLVPHVPKLNGKDIDPYDWSPLTREGGVTMTGSRFLSNLGAEINDSDDDGITQIIYAGHTLKLKLGSKTGTLDGVRITLQAAPLSGERPSGTVYGSQIPAASVVRALGGKAYYNQKEHRLFLWLKDLSKR